MLPPGVTFDFQTHLCMLCEIKELLETHWSKQTVLQLLASASSRVIDRRTEVTLSQIGKISIL